MKPLALLGPLVLLLLLPLGGCDLLEGEEEAFDVPPERLVAMVAVYGSQVDAVHRLVVADIENPSDYRVLRKAGTHVTGTCFAPDKRRILFADGEDTIVGTRAHLKLYDLDTDEVRALDAPAAATHGGTNERCLWNPDGSGFYYQAAGPAGSTYPTYYDLGTEEARPFGRMGRRFLGWRGHDSVLVSMGTLYEPEAEGASTFCFIDASTDDVLECLPNEYLMFIPWEDEQRGGWKHAAYGVTYEDPPNLLAFQRSVEGEDRLVVTNLDGSFHRILASGALVYMDLAWATGKTVLFTQRLSYDPPRLIYVADVETGAVRSLVEPDVIDGARRLTEPDF